jgi:hypothetical protein
LTVEAALSKIGFKRRSVQRVPKESYPFLQSAAVKTDIVPSKINTACLQISADSVTKIYTDVLGNKYREMNFSAILFIRFTTETEQMRIRNIVNF